MFVWIVSAMTVTKVVEGCAYIRRRYYGILPRVGGEFEHSALSPISLSRSVLKCNDLKPSHQTAGQSGHPDLEATNNVLSPSVHVELRQRWLRNSTTVC